MQEYINFLLTQIVSKPEELKVTEEVEGTVVRIHICASEQDMGVIIGKHGKTIRAIRNLARAKAIRDNVKVFIEVC